MGDDVIHWGDAVPVTDRTETDFQNRIVTVSVYDTSGETRSVLKGLAEDTDVAAPAAADRAVRSYLAHLIDTNEIPDYREEYNVTALLPPEGWINPTSLPSITPSEIIDKDPRLTFSVPPAVDDMLRDLSDRGEFESKSAFVKSAIKWYGGVKDAELSAADLLPLSFLLGTEARRHLVDFFLVEASTDRALTKADIARETDLSRTSIVNHIKILVEYGIVESEGDERPRYRPAVDNDSYDVLAAANQVLYERIS